MVLSCTVVWPQTSLMTETCCHTKPTPTYCLPAPPLAVPTVLRYFFCNVLCYSVVHLQNVQRIIVTVIWVFALLVAVGVVWKLLFAIKILQIHTPSRFNAISDKFNDHYFRQTTSESPQMMCPLFCIMHMFILFLFAGKKMISVENISWTYKQNVPFLHSVKYWLKVLTRA